MEWLTLITTFLQPILLKCWDKTSAEDPEVVHDALPATRRAVRRARHEASREERQTFPRYTREELYQLAESTLIESMNATPETVARVKLAAAGLPDNE